MTTERDGENSRLIDTATAVDVGQGYALAWCVDADGASWPILYDARQLEPQVIPYLPEHFRALAPHELTGQLPEAFRQFRCGAPTRSGRPCRTTVPGPRTRCRHHPETPTSKPAPLVADAELVLFDLDAEDDR